MNLRLFLGLFTIAAIAIINGANAATEIKSVNPSGEPPLTAEQSAQAVKELRSKKLELPIEAFDVAKIKGSFYETHGGVMHGAADMLAPRNTPVHAVENGTIAKLFDSKRGGLTIYEADPSGRFVYYYAHLEKYADSIHDGDAVKRGQVIGYVGTSGNAPPNTPHLHFSVGVGDALKKWWITSSVDPYEVFKQ
ncbi:MAG: M23 family metallopeptidase [Candidatus Melainabacteria bacterium]|nr:M23 family metallopeptidase [Candidatus Melainabacteria bacterium]